jgi:hypothetical protein
VRCAPTDYFPFDFFCEFSNCDDSANNAKTNERS